MRSSWWKTPVVVIADDFTGANDAGSGLAHAGARVHVLFSPAAPETRGSADVWVIRTCQHASQRHEIEHLCQQFQLTRQLLGEMSRPLCATQLPHALYLSGGDVAIAVAQALGASGFHIQGLVAGCVPHEVLLNSEFTLPVMTKAGGFGDENTLVAAIGFLEEKSSE